MKELIAAVDVKLTEEEIAALEKPYQPHTILGHAQPDAESNGGEAVGRREMVLVPSRVHCSDAVTITAVPDAILSTPMSIT